MSVLMDFKAIWVTNLGRLVNCYRRFFCSSLLFPSSESVQSKLLSLNSVDPEVEASKRFLNFTKYSPISQNHNPQHHNWFADGLCVFLTILLTSRRLKMKSQRRPSSNAGKFGRLLIYSYIWQSFFVHKNYTFQIWTVTKLIQLKKNLIMFHTVH